MQPDLEAALEVVTSPAGFLRMAGDAWTAPHAILVVQVANPGSLDEALYTGEERIQALLEARAARGEWPDAYLLLVLPGPPAETELLPIRRVEIDPGTCRKHVVWCDPVHGWRRSLERVTCLALPPPTPPAPPSPPPDLTAEEAALLADIDAHGVRGARRRRADALAAQEASHAD